jgi:hypothetical protein
MSEIESFVAESPSARVQSLRQSRHPSEPSVFSFHNADVDARSVDSDYGSSVLHHTNQGRGSNTSLPGAAEAQTVQAVSWAEIQTHKWQGFARVTMKASWKLTDFVDLN